CSREKRSSAGDEVADEVAFLDQLLGGEADLLFREGVVLKTLHDLPALAVALYREPELEPLGDSILAPAGHGHGRPVARGRAAVAALCEVDGRNRRPAGAGGAARLDARRRALWPG